MTAGGREAVVMAGVLRIRTRTRKTCVARTSIVS